MIDTAYFYDYFSVRLKGMRAFMFYDLQGSPMNLVEESDYELVRPFDISLDLSLLTVPTNDLAKVMLAGGLPSLKLYMTKEKLINLISLLDVLTETDKVPVVVLIQTNLILILQEPPPTSNDTMKKKRRAKRAEAKGMPPNVIQMKGTFKIEELVLCLRSGAEKRGYFLFSIL